MNVVSKVFFFYYYFSCNDIHNGFFTCHVPGKLWSIKNKFKAAAISFVKNWCVKYHHVWYITLVTKNSKVFEMYLLKLCCVHIQKVWKHFGEINFSEKLNSLKYDLICWHFTVILIVLEIYIIENVSTRIRLFFFFTSTTPTALWKSTRKISVTVPYNFWSFYFLNSPSFRSSRNYHFVNWNRKRTGQRRTSRQCWVGQPTSRKPS